MSPENSPSNARPIRRVPQVLARTFNDFVQTESSSGIVLLAISIIALVWANIDFYSYDHLWHESFTLQFGNFELKLDIHHWINDGLMAIFFFLVGLEIKHEIQTGELSSLKKSMLPIMTALGGMIFPALLYVMLNAGGPGSAGWGIPMATDIAFALGVLTLAGGAVPFSLRVLLTALAIVDDLGAIVVIALFYTEDIETTYLMWGGVVFVALLVLNFANVRWQTAYILLGLVLWYCLLQSGVHATIAGVLLAFCIPGKNKLDTDGFLKQAEAIIKRLRETARHKDRKVLTEDQMACVHDLELQAERVQPPLQRMEHGLRNWVAFFIMPVFALSNAGVSLSGMSASDLASPISLGIILGLFVGKQVGILFAAWLSIKMRWAEMPRGVSWKMIWGVSMLGGIGFTMSLFVANLAFSSAEMLDTAKIGVLSATLISGVFGSLLLRRAIKDNAKQQDAVEEELPMTDEPEPEPEAVAPAEA